MAFFSDHFGLVFASHTLVPFSIDLVDEDERVLVCSFEAQRVGVNHNVIASPIRYAPNNPRHQVMFTSLQPTRERQRIKMPPYFQDVVVDRPQVIDVASFVPWQEATLKDVGKLILAVPPPMFLDVRTDGESKLIVDLSLRIGRDPLRCVSEDVLAPLRRTLLLLLPSEQLRDLFEKLETQSAFNPLRLYRQVSRPFGRVSDEDCLRIQHAKLVSVLRPYQMRAVMWAMSVELHGLRGLQEFLDEVWLQLHVPLGRLEGVRMNPLSGQVFQTPVPPLPRVSRVHSGILADEMGLGKTLETIALILNNPTGNKPWPAVAQREQLFKKQVHCICGNDSSGELKMVQCTACLGKMHALCAAFPPEGAAFVCPTCLFETNVKMPSRTTIVVSPQPIINQWIEEIKKHAPSMSVHIYEGVKGAQATLLKHVERAQRSKPFEEELRRKKHTLPVVHPHQLDGFDVVLISYQTLRAEQAHEDFQAKNLRHARRFPIIPCAVLRASYHRVVLDEAQMVGGGGAVTVAAKMALALEGTHRWAVSGTPFKRSTRDIQGLFKFLRLEPLADKRFFEAVVGIPSTSGDEASQTRLVQLLNLVMWRTAKKDAKIGIADSIVVVRSLDFTTTERFHYERMSRLCLEALEKGGKRQGKQSNAAIELMRLRHACDHFQLGDQHLNLAAGKKFQIVKKTLTLEDLQASLMETERLEYISSCRDWIASQCGLAGVLILEKSFEEARRVYNGIIENALEEKDGKVDSQQMLHAAFNLLQCVELSRNKKAAQEGADLVRARELLGKLETAFLREAREAAQASFAALDGVKLQIDNFNVRPWWTETLRAMPEDDVEELLRRLAMNAHRSSVLRERLAGCKSAEGLNALVQGLLEDLQMARRKIMQALDERMRPRAQRDPTSLEVKEQSECGHCHRHKDEEGQEPVARSTCSLCRFETECILPYERIVYLIDETQCPKCDDAVVVHSQGQVRVDGDDEIEQLAQSEEAFREKSIVEVRKMCKERGLKVKGSKQEMVTRLLNDLNAPNVKSNSAFCGGCKRWWHMRCLPKEVQKMLDKPGESDDWECPVCLGQAVQEGHSAGRVRHPGLANQLLLAIRPFHAKLFGSGADEENGDDDEELDNDELANAKEKEARRHLKDYFGVVEVEVEKFRSVFTALHNMTGVHNMLEQCKMRVRLARDDEEITDENERIVIPKSLLPERRMQFEMDIEDHDAQRRAALSKYRFLKNNGEQSSNCPICLEDLAGNADIALLPCSHKSHWDCAQQWWDREVKKKREERWYRPNADDNPTCSVCRAAAPKSEVKRIQNNRIEVKERIELDNAPALAQPVLMAAPLCGGVMGSWGTKISALIADLRACLAWKEPTRIILFSQFPEMLPVVKEACAANGLSEYVLFGKSGAATQKSIETFKVRARKERFVVLLLPISRGAEGLTLIEGNVIMLLEPAFPMALEQQAIARIHRIGQMHDKTYVYRYIVKQTVEQRIAEIGAEESLEVDAESPALMNDDTVQKLLLPPSAKFDARRIAKPEEEQAQEGFDEDELWWLTKVRHNNQIKTRRDVLERYLKMEAEVATEVLYGAEVPKEAVKVLKSLKEID